MRNKETRQTELLVCSSLRSCSFMFCSFSFVSRMDLIFLWLFLSCLQFLLETSKYVHKISPQETCLKKLKKNLKNATVKTYNRHGLGHIHRPWE